MSEFFFLIKRGSRPVQTLKNSIQEKEEQQDLEQGVATHGAESEKQASLHMCYMTQIFGACTLKYELMFDLFKSWK